MDLLLVLVLIAAIIAGGVALTNRERRQKELREADRLAPVRRAVDEDVTRFGEELQQLHIETMTTQLDTAMRQDYQRALDAYEHAKELLADARTQEDLSEVTRTLEDGRYAQACVLARQNGDPLPQRRPPCFFNPAHGPAQTDVEWAPPGGAPREIPVCLADADRVKAGAEPDVRRVRAGNRMVPWYQGGPMYAPYANGYYGMYAMNGLFPGILIGSMMAGMWSPVVIDSGGEGSGGEDWSGGDSGGGDYGGGDYGGGDYGGGDYGGGDYGGGDYGGGDYGGGDFGGGGFGDFGGGDFGGF